MCTLQALEDRGRTDLFDAASVKAVTREYMEHCSEAGSLPTVMGLSAALGISRRWLNRFLREHPETEGAKFLEVVKELFADVLTQAGLSKHISEALTIFILKNTASMADKVEIEAAAHVDETEAPEDLENRILGSIPTEDYTELETED